MLYQDQLSLLRMGAEMGERLQQVFCFRARGGTRTLGLEEKREIEDLKLEPCFNGLLAYLAGFAVGLLVNVR